MVSAIAKFLTHNDSVEERQRVELDGGEVVLAAVARDGERSANLGAETSLDRRVERELM